MMAKMRGVLPLAVSIAVLAYLYVEFTLNFTFHWVTDGDLGNGLALPSNFHLVVPAGFVTWGIFFMLGADNKAALKTLIAAVVGSLGALALMILGPKIADLPDFFGIAIAVAIVSLILVLAIPLSDNYNVAATFPPFASVVFWWIATGLDGWAKNGGGVGNSVAALGDPATAGAGAFGGGALDSVPHGVRQHSGHDDHRIDLRCGVGSVERAPVATKGSGRPVTTTVPCHLASCRQ